MPRSLNPHLAELPATEGFQRWRCTVCDEMRELPKGGPIAPIAIALGCFSEAHRHPEKHAALLASNPT